MSAAQPMLPPLSLYLHFPWCVRKCPYCDFNSHTLHGQLPEADYVQALLSDLAAQHSRSQGRALQSLFLGGGTPSLFTPASLQRLFEGVRALLPWAPDAEVTLEANPGTIERGRFAEYRAAGVTRVSLGAQSFAPSQLQGLGRIHAVADTERAVAELHAAGLTNFNLDLMYGLPAQTIDEALADIECALALKPAHVSHYQLTLEPGTLFGARPPAGLPDTDLSGDMQRLCQQRLASAGFEQYEVSAYARAGARCRHNLNYWQFGDYLGVGAGAHGKSSQRAAGRLQIARSARQREPRRYLAQFLRAGEVLASDSHEVAASDVAFEFMMNALRLTSGFDETLYEARTGLTLAASAPALQRAEARGLLERTASGWRPTSHGLNFLNDLLTEFLPSGSESMRPPPQNIPAAGGG